MQKRKQYLDGIEHGDVVYSFFTGKELRVLRVDYENDKIILEDVDHNFDYPRRVYIICDFNGNIYLGGGQRTKMPMVLWDKIDTYDINKLPKRAQKFEVGKYYIIKCKSERTNYKYITRIKEINGNIIKTDINSFKYGTYDVIPFESFEQYEKL